MADDAVAVLDAEGIERAHVMGASMGGVIAQIIAVLHPSACARSTLACTACRHHEWRRELLAEWAEAVGSRAWRRSPATGCSGWSGRASGAGSASGSTCSPASCCRAAGDRSSRRSHAILDASDDVRFELENVHVPTLVITGSQDALTPVGDAEELAELIPRARLEVIAGAAHGLMVEAPNGYNDAVLRFLDDVDTGVAADARRRAPRGSPSAESPDARPQLVRVDEAFDEHDGLRPAVTVGVELVGAVRAPRRGLAAGPGDVEGGVDGAVGVDEPARAPRPVAPGRAGGRAGPRSSLSSLERVDDGQRVDALEQVLPAGLPSGTSVPVRSRTSSTIWKHMPRWRPKSVSASSVGRRPPRPCPPMRHAVANSDSGLALDRRRVRLLAAVDVEEVLQLEHLAPAQLADRRREQHGDVGAERCGPRRRPREQVVAGEDRDDVAPPGVDARHAAPGLGLVDHVVVVQRTEVHELDADRAGDRRLRRRRRRRRSPRTAAQSVRTGPEALAAGLDQVGRDLAEEAVGAAHGVPERGLDPVEVGGQRRELQGPAGRMPAGYAGLHLCSNVPEARTRPTRGRGTNRAGPSFVVLTERPRSTPKPTQAVAQFVR